MKFKTTDAGTTLDYLGTMRVLSHDDLSYDVELEVMRSGINANNWNYHGVDKYASTFAGQPILTAYIGEKIGDGHNMEKKVDRKTGEVYYSFTSPTAERIVGIISDNPADIRTEQRGDDMWVIAKGKLWRFYHRELVDKIASQGGMRVSAETEVKEEHENGKIIDITVWRGLGVTLLGDNVAPAIPGANIKELAAAEKEFESMKLYAASLVKKGVNNRKMDKVTIAELQKLFPNHVVLGGNELSVCLLSADGAAARYEYANKEDMTAVVPERIERATASAVYTMSDGSTVNIDLCEVTAGLSCKLNAATAALEKATTDLAAANATIATMTANEAKRRVEAVKSAVRAEFTRLNANESEPMDESVCNAIVEAADKGEYAECANAEGEWCGDVAACTALKAQFADHITSVRTKLNESKQTTLVWNSINTTPKDQKGIEGALARINQ